MAVGTAEATPGESAVEPTTKRSLVTVGPGLLAISKKLLKVEQTST